MFARDADDVVVTRNVVFGTVQAITNTRGSGWDVSHNLIVGLTALPCDGSGPCGGGSGIGVLVANECCGDAPFSTSEHITVIGTLAPETDVAVWIAPGNAVGARVRHTVGAVVIDEALP